MSGTECGAVRESIPDVGAGRADEDVVRRVTAHVAGCADCASELELVRSVFVGRPRIPADLSQSVVHGVRGKRRSLQRPWWGISAAAVAALALGIGITSAPSRDGASDAESIEVVVDAESDEFWLADDGILAGAPVFEALSDEALAEFLDELSTLQGGQA